MTAIYHSVRKLVKVFDSDVSQEDYVSNDIDWCWTKEHTIE